MKISLTNVAASLIARGIPAQLEMTGGNVGTLYVGDKVAQLGGYEAVVGPGNYTTGMAHVSEVCVGPDDLYGESAVTYFHEGCSEQDVVTFVANFVEGRRGLRRVSA